MMSAMVSGLIPRTSNWLRVYTCPGGRVGGGAASAEALMFGQRTWAAWLGGCMDRGLWTEDYSKNHAQGVGTDGYKRTGDVKDRSQERSAEGATG